MRAARYGLCAVLVVALARPACGAELTADEAIDRMLAANGAWLKADFNSLTYTLDRDWYGGQTVRVAYRAPRDLRVEIEPGGAFHLLRDGRGFAGDNRAWAEEWDADWVLDAALQGLVFRGAAWILANHRNRCHVSEFRRERVDARNAYHLVVSGYYPTDDGLIIPPPATDQNDARHLWIDAKDFRPLREAWDCAGTAELIYCVLRYQDYRPFPPGGQAPMRLEQYPWPDWPEQRPLDADTTADPRRVHTYQVVDRKHWFRKASTEAGRPDETVTEVSTTAVLAAEFDDAGAMSRIDQVREIYERLGKLEREGRWEELYADCDREIARAVRAVGEYASFYAYHLYFWRGEYDKVIAVRGHRGGYPYLSDIYLAWSYDALGRRAEAERTYRGIAKKYGGPEYVPAEVKQGLARPWVPIAERLKPRTDERPLAASPRWRAKSNVAGDNPQAAIDGDRRTAWVSRDSQRPGMWFQVDLGEPTPLSRLAFDSAGDLTMEDERYPREYAVMLSTDGTRWATVARGVGLMDNLVAVTFEPQRVRYVRIEQRGKDAYNPWSVHEVFFYAPK